MYVTSEQECGRAIEEVLHILGGKWAFMVIGHLHHGPQRFNQLKRNLSGVSTQSLTVVLRHLEQNGIVVRQVFPTVPVTVEYSLTERGKDFQHVLEPMRHWGEKWTSRKPEAVEAHAEPPDQTETATSLPVN